MEKKIARLRRWLDRLACACENRRWDFAVAEADCLSAELKNVREDIVSLLAAEDLPHRRMFSIESVGISLRSALLSLLMLLALCAPLSVDADRPFAAPQARALPDANDEHLSWVTDEEERLIKALRSDLNNNNPSAIMFAAKPKARNMTAKLPQPRVQVEPAAAARDASLAPEEMLALVQAGERALHEKDPVIKVIK